MTMHLLLMDDSNFDAWLTRIKPWADFTAEHSGARYDGDHVIAKARSGDIQIFLIVDNQVAKALLTTEIIDFPKMREFRILTGTGIEMNTWIELLPSLEKFARNNNCTRIGMMARPGWERVLKYTKTHVHLEKDL